MGLGGPQRPDYRGAAQEQAQASAQNVNQQTQANRPNQSTPFGQVQWTQNPDGSWVQSSGLAAGLQPASQAVMNQAQQALGTPLDFGSLPQLDTGASARDQAIKAAYGQATSRLDPQWAQRQEQAGAQLANQGLDPNSQAYRNAMRQFGQQRNDAYSSAMNGAIDQGTAAGQAVFQQSLLGRQQKMAEMLRQRAQPLEEMQALGGLATNMPGFHGAGLAETAQYLPASLAQAQWDYQQDQLRQQQAADVAKGISNLGSGLSDLIPFAM